MDDKKIIELVPRPIAVDKDPRYIRKIDRWSKDAKCFHESAQFSHDETRREVFCRVCNEEVDPFAAFLCLGRMMDRVRNDWEAVQEFYRKEKAEKNLKMDRLMERERMRPESEQIKCFRCNSLVIQKQKRRGGGYVWLECWTCGSGWCREAFHDSKARHEAEQHVKKFPEPA